MSIFIYIFLLLFYSLTQYLSFLQPIIKSSNKKHINYKKIIKNLEKNYKYTKIKLIKHYKN